MANQIRLKRASGSNPSASDLVTGEIAVRTDNGKLFTKKDDGSVAEISGGGIDDGDKGDITVSNSGATFTIDNDAVTYAKIQNVSATNRILGRDSSGAGVIEEITPANLRTMLNVADGATNVTNTNQLTNGAGFITATLTNEQVQDIVGGMVSGNTESGITVTYQDGDGTLDFSVASQTDNNFTNADHSKLDGIEAGATADQTASEILTLIKTVDGAGSGLNADLLDGISSASFVRSDADDTLSGQYIISDSADEKLQLAGSSNPYIRWQEGTTDKAYIQWNAAGGYLAVVNQESSEQLRLGSGSNGLTFVEGGNTRNVYHTGNLSVGDGGLTSNNFTDSDHSKLNGIESGATADQSASEILTLLKTVDGAGSGLDADTLDGVSSASFARSDASDTMSGNYTFSSSSQDVINFSNNSSNDNRGIAFNSRTAISADYNDGYLRLNNASEFSNGVYTPLVMRADGGFNVDNSTVIDGSGNIVASKVPTLNQNTTGTSGGFTAGNASNLNSGTVPQARLSASTLLTLVKTVDGGGSGLDADTVDGIQATNFLRSDQADTASGDITFSGGAGAATIAANSDIRFTNGNWTGNATKIQQHSNILYIVGGSAGIIFRESGTNRFQIDGSGHFVPSSDSTYNIGANGTRVANGYFDTLYGDGSNLTGISAGATGGGSDEVFYENDQTVTSNYTITNGKNAMAAGPITINSGVTVTVGSGETLTIV